jgi:NADPH:quinone reductase-like Zn-dependent oxidoreductase
MNATAEATNRARMTNGTARVEGTMRAAVYSRYGSADVVEVKQVPKPLPRDGEILIRVRATTVTTGDWRARSLELPRGFGLMGRLMFGIFGPRQPILGTELAGDVEAVGKKVTRFRVGDHVIAFSDSRMGAHAEYKCMPENGWVALKPANVSYEEAAALPFGGTTALAFFRKAGIKRGDRVLVNGASGAVGTAAVQLAKHFGAEVTGVCGTSNLEMVRSIGADQVIDYTREDFTGNGQTYDIIVDAVGTAPFSRSKGSLAKKGRLLAVLADLSAMLAGPWLSISSGKRVIAGPAMVRSEDLGLLAMLAETGELRPVIGRRFPLEQIAEAHRYVETGHKRGNVVITVDVGPM